MKYNFAITLIFFTLFSCKEERKPQHSYTLSGKISNIKNNEHVTVELFSHLSPTVEFSITDNQYFSKQITTPVKQGFFYFSTPQTHITSLFSKNDSIHIEFDANDIQHTIQFSGDLSNENNCNQKLKSIQQRFTDKERNSPSKSYNQYKQEALQCKQELLNHLKKTRYKFHSLKRAKQLEIEHDYLLLLLSYNNPMLYKPMTNSEFKQLKKDIKSFDLNNKYNIYNPNYAITASNVLQYAPEYINKGAPNYFHILKDRVISEIKNAKNRDLVLFQLIKEYIWSTADTTLNQKLIEEYNKEFSNEIYKTEVKKVIELQRDKAISFTVYKNNLAPIDIDDEEFHNKVKMFLFHSDYCNHCDTYIETTYNRLYNNFHTKDVVFINVFMRKDWNEDYLKHIEIKGISAMSYKDTEKIIQTLNLTQLPAVVVFDKDNKIIMNTPNADYEKLEKLLKDATL